MDSVKNSILSAVFASVAGFWLGYYAHGVSEDAKKFEVVTEAQRQTAQDIRESAEVSDAIEGNVTTSNQFVSSIKKRAVAHVAQEKTNEASLRVGCSQLIDSDTVFLLNAARAGSPSGSPAGSDATLKAASSVGLAEFIDNDLEVVGMYHELAIRHDALVDYVEGQIARQAQD